MTYRMKVQTLWKNVYTYTEARYIVREADGRMYVNLGHLLLHTLKNWDNATIILG